MLLGVQCAVMRVGVLVVVVVATVVVVVVRVVGSSKVVVVISRSHMSNGCSECSTSFLYISHILAIRDQTCLSVRLFINQELSQASLFYIRAIFDHHILQ